jgi:hypothetical protein
VDNCLPGSVKNVHVESKRIFVTAPMWFVKKLLIVVVTVSMCKESFWVKNQVFP